MNQSVLRRITPTTAALLRWWFNPERVQARAGLGFHERQRQAILRTITAQEGMGMAELRLARPVHRMALTTDGDQIPVVLALLIWQLLNSNDARAASIDDPRFTRHFVIVEHQPSIRDQLMTALSGPPLPYGNGARDFSQADIVRLASLLIPHARRDEVFAFVHGSVCSGAKFAHDVESKGVIAITDGRVEALECLARLRDAMVFDDETRPPYYGHREHSLNGVAWRRHLRRFASGRHGVGVQVVFSDT